MPQEVIDRVHTIAERQKTPSGLEFLRRDGTQFEDIIDGPVSPMEDANASNGEDVRTMADVEVNDADMVTTTTKQVMML